MNILITGAGGMVGSRLAEGLQKNGITLLTPTHKKLDITSNTLVDDFFRQNQIDVVVHAAVYGDNDKAEIERGNTNGECWKVNVEGTKHIASAAVKTGAQLIYISTGSVFSGSESNPGPFTESDTPFDEQTLSWYAWTKAYAERCVGPKAAILRLSRPVGGRGVKQTDYIERALALVDREMVYPLFTDQYFPITFLNDVILAIQTIVREKCSGIYHVVSSDTTNPYELMSYVCKRTGRDASVLKKTTFASCIASAKSPKRYSQFCAITGDVTNQKLHLPRRCWKEIINCVYPSS